MKLKMAIVNNRMENRILVLIQKNTLDILQPIFDDFLIIKNLEKMVIKGKTNKPHKSVILFKN